MTGPSADPLIAAIIKRHGGSLFWSRLGALDAEISASGFLFSAKHRPVLDHVRVRAFTREPRFIFFDLPGPGLNSELIGNDEVRIARADGTVIENRREPRRAFKGIRRQFFWDALDFAYFGGYATWNYLVTPFIFLRPGFRFERMARPQGIDQGWTLLKTIFPDDLPTHSKSQIFYFDDQLSLRRLDYTAEVVGGWAHAAHLCYEYQDFSGLKIATKRKVLPLLTGNRPLPGPTLVSITIHDMQMIYA